MNTEAMNIGIWGLSGTGKTSTAASITELADHTPMLIASCDKGTETIAPLIQAGKVRVVQVDRYLEVRAIAAEVKHGHITGKVDAETAKRSPNSWCPDGPFAGHPYRVYCVDALSTLNILETKARNLTDADPGDIAGKLKTPFRVMVADLRELAEAGVTVIQICHAAQRGTGVSNQQRKDGAIAQRPAPDLYPSMQETWKSSLDFQWMIERFAGDAPDGSIDWVNALFRVYLQPIHQIGVPHHVPEIKTRSVAFARLMGPVRVLRPGTKEDSLAEMIRGARMVDRVVQKYIAAGKTYRAAIDLAIDEITKPKK